MTNPTFIIQKVEYLDKTVYRPYLHYDGKWFWNRYFSAIISTGEGFASFEFTSAFPSVASDEFNTHEEAVQHAIKYLLWTQKQIDKPIMTTISEYTIGELLLKNILND